jgi:hypothetical protein
MESAEAETEVLVVEEEPRAGGLARGLAVVGAIVLGLLAAIAVLAMVEIADLTTCYDANRDPDFSETDCFEGSSKRKLLTLVLGIPGALLVAASAVLLLAFAIRGRGWRYPLIAAVAGAVLFGLGILVGSLG